MLSSVVPPVGLRSVLLDIEENNLGFTRVAERLGAEQRSPSRVEVDGAGVPRTLVVHVLRIEP